MRKHGFAAKKQAWFCRQENCDVPQTFGFEEAAMVEIVHPHDDPFYGELRAFANRDGFVVIEMKEEREAPFLVLSALEAACLMPED
ncbi:MAG TPA: hypothetical protein VNZ61_02930 [Roseomonas sp.]|nr:hypothetical protein [Roseomonas sp.]